MSQKVFGVSGQFLRLTYIGALSSSDEWNTKRSFNEVLVTFSENTLDKRAELVAVATAMLENRLDLIEGVRKICALRHAIGDSANDVFVPIRAIDSETDHFPLGEIRAQCASDYLERMDLEMEHYLADASDDIFRACKEIVRVFS